jgi:hypothetical protein
MPAQHVPACVLTLLQALLPVTVAVSCLVFACLHSKVDAAGGAAVRKLHRPVAHVTRAAAKQQTAWE